ncbi:MAG: hypothetical protein Fur0025_05440 [Oscillatoriaceae cyanobacterium]
MPRILTKILLVEDNPADAELIGEILAVASSWRFELFYAVRLKEAIALLARAASSGSEGFDVILLDLSLPDSTGIETLQQTLASAPKLPVVVLTSLNDEEVAVEAVRSGAQDYLIKGELDWRLLVRAIRYAIERKQTLEALRHSEERFQKLATTLDLLVQQRTAQLQQALEFEGMVKRITDKVRDSLDRNQILQTAVNELASVTGVKYSETALYENTVSDTEKEFCPYYQATSSQKFIEKQDFTQITKSYACIYQENLRRGENLLFCDATANVAVLACPIRDDNGLLGALWLLHPQERGFEDLEVRMVQQVATTCAIALHQARLYQASLAQVEELERLNRIKDDFLSTISHELRTPVANIKMGVSMLQLLIPPLTTPSPNQYEPDDGLQGVTGRPSMPHINVGGHPATDTSPLSHQKRDVASPRSTPTPNSAESTGEKISTYFKILQDECDREIALIGDLLDLQRLDAGAFPLESIPLDLYQWIPHIVEPFQQRSQSQQLTLSLEIAPNLPILIGDPGALSRIISELLENACKHSPPGERISFLAQRTADGQLQLLATNSGVEIPPKYINHVFDKFYRIPSDDPWKLGGTGLGLALVQKLVAHLGGSIHVSSASAQTVFIVQLPFSPELKPSETV